MGSHFTLSQIDTLHCQQKELEQRRTKVAPCGYCGGQKGTFQDKATSNSEEIKPVGLSIVKLCLAEGISQLVENY